MEFQNNNGTASKEEAASKTNIHVAQNGAAKNNVPTAKANHGNRSSESKTAVKPEPLPAGQASAGEEKPTPAPEPAKAGEPAKEEPKAEIQQPTAEAAPVLTLEAKLKAVEALHRKTIQRLSLITRMKELEGFEVKLLEEGDEIENNPYQGCKLIIQDDKKREFVTMTPGLIRMVAQFIFDACAVKLEEIESAIEFPTA